MQHSIFLGLPQGCHITAEHGAEPQTPPHPALRPRKVVLLKNLYSPLVLLSRKMEQSLACVTLRLIYG